MKKMKKVFGICGMVVGVILVILGLKLAKGISWTYDGKNTSSYTFGADFYTEQYAATKNVADNIAKLGDYLERVVDFGFKMAGYIVAAIGGVTICCFGMKLANTDTPTDIPTYDQIRRIENSIERLARGQTIIKEPATTDKENNHINEAMAVKNDRLDHSNNDAVSTTKEIAEKNDARPSKENCENQIQAGLNSSDVKISFTTPEYTPAVEYKEKWVCPNCGITNPPFVVLCVCKSGKRPTPKN